MGAAFAVPAYRRYWASQLVSSVGTWAQMLAQSWLVLQITGSAVALGIVTTLQFLPMLVFPLLGGVIADRVPRRRLLIVTQAGACLQAFVLGLLVLTGQVQYWEVCVLALVLGLTNAFGNPAQQALVPEIVGPALVGNAVALNSVQFNVARILGGAVGGVAVAVLGVAPTLLLNAASYLPAIAVLVMLRPAYAVAAGPTDRRFAGQIGDGIRYALGNRAIRRVLALFGVVGLLGFNWSVAVPLLAVSLGVGPTGYGTMSAGLGAGSLVAGVYLMRSRVADERRLVAGGIGMGGMIVLLGLSGSYGASLALMVVAGLAGIMATVTANTRLQLLTPDAYRGRVMSMFVMLMGGTTPIGGFLLGAIAQAWGIRIGLQIFGTLVIAGLVAILVLDRNREPEPDPGSAAPRDGGTAPAPDGGTAPTPDGGPPAPPRDGGPPPAPDGGPPPAPDGGPPPAPDAAHHRPRTARWRARRGSEPADARRPCLPAEAFGGTDGTRGAGRVRPASGRSIRAASSSLGEGSQDSGIGGGRLRSWIRSCSRGGSSASPPSTTSCSSR